MPSQTGQSDRRRLEHDPGWWGAETASHDVEAAPGHLIFVSGMLDGRRQSIAIDENELDELIKRLHQAKRVAREGRS
jgi:hypothetical protein